MSVPNDELIQILDHLNDKNKVVAKSFHDDYLTTEDIIAIEQGRMEYQNGQTKSLEDLKRELDI